MAGTRTEGREPQEVDEDVRQGTLDDETAKAKTETFEALARLLGELVQGVGDTEFLVGCINDWKTFGPLTFVVTCVPDTGLRFEWYPVNPTEEWEEYVNERVVSPTEEYVKETENEKAALQSQGTQEDGKVCC